MRLSWICEICHVTTVGVKLLLHLPFLDFSKTIPIKTFLLGRMILKFTQGKERLKAENNMLKFMHVLKPVGNISNECLSLKTW